MYYGTWCQHLGIQLFRERLSEKLCTRQSRKVIWDMINTLFLTTVAVEPTFVAFLKHSQTHFHGLSCLFFQISLKKRELKTTHNVFQDCRALFPTTFLEIAVSYTRFHGQVILNVLRTFSVHLFHSFYLIGGHRVSKTQFFSVVVLRCIISLSFLSTKWKGRSGKLAEKNWFHLWRLKHDSVTCNEL